MRTIDDVISYINNHENISAIQKRILINRINKPPTVEEREVARKEVEEAYKNSKKEGGD